MAKRHYEPRPVFERRFAEHCQYGDLVEWSKPPRIIDGLKEGVAPSNVGVIAMFVGPAPHSAFARFYLSEPYEGEPNTEPYQIARAQRLTVLRGR